MPASVSSPADVVNLALAAIGHPGRVGNLFDGSEAAKKALDVYAEARDQVLRVKDWPFALRQRPGVAGAVVPQGWAHSWAYPDDCIRVRSVTPSPIPSPNYDPRPLEWAIFNDYPVGTGLKLILTQITPIKINYVGQVTDMALWEPLFVEAVVQALAAKLGPSLRKQIAPLIDVQGAIGTAAGADEMLAPDDSVVSVQPPPAAARPQQ